MQQFSANLKASLTLAMFVGMMTYFKCYLIPVKGHWSFQAKEKTLVAMISGKKLTGNTNFISEKRNQAFLPREQINFMKNDTNNAPIIRIWSNKGAKELWPNTTNNS